MSMQNFWGVKEVHYGIVQVVNMMKKDISAKLYWKCLILCSKIVLNVLHNTSLTVLLPWQHACFQTSPIVKVF